MSIPTTLIGVVAGILGVGGLVISIKVTDDLRRILLAGEPGQAKTGQLVKASGTVESASELVTAPLSGNSCIGYVLAQQQYYWAGGLPLHRWHTHRVWRAVPTFVIEDASGTRTYVRMGRGDEREPIRTSGSDAPGELFSDLQLERDELTQRYESEESPPTRLVEVLGRDATDANNPHRYGEWRLEDGDEVSVVGPVADVDDDTVTIDDRGDVFILTESSARSVVLAQFGRALAYAVFGFGTLGIAALLALDAFL